MRPKLSVPGNEPQSVATQSWTFRQCLFWCMPALVVGAILRLAFLLAIPEAYYGSDSSSYFNATVKLYSKGKLDIESKRRWLYPILLMGSPPMPGSVPQTVAIVQHLLGLGIILGIGWIAGSVAACRGPTAGLAALLAAIWPRMLWYEHEMVAECWMLAAFVGTLVLAFPLLKLNNGRRLFWFLVAAGLIAAFKPHGRPLWLALLTLIGLWHFRSFRWPHFAVVAGTLVLVLTSGNDRQGSWLLLSSTLPLVKTDGAKWAEYRAALKPTVEKVRQDLENYPYIQNRFKKPLKREKNTPEFGPVWAELNRDDAKFAIVAKQLALEGIRTHPIDFTTLVRRRISFVLADPTSADDFPVQHFWDQQVRRNIEHAEENPRQLPLLYGMDEAARAKMVAERRNRSLWFEPWLSQAGNLATWMQLQKIPGKPIPEPVMKWTGWLALAGVLALALRRQWRPLALLILPAGFYVIVIFSVGDRVARYLHPVDWIGLSLIVFFFDGIAAGVTKLRSRIPKDSPTSGSSTLQKCVE